MTDNKKFVRQFSQSVKDTTSHLGKETLSFFGISEPNIDEVEAWNQRRLKFVLQKFGNIITSKLKEEDEDGNVPSTSFSYDESEFSGNHPLRSVTPLITSSMRPAFTRGKSAPLLINRQISLRSHIVAPSDRDTSGSVGSCNYKKDNAVKAISKMIKLASQKTQLAVNNSVQRNQNFNFSNQNLNTIDRNSDVFFKAFRGAKYNRNISRMSVKHAIKKNLHNNFIFRLICCLMKHDNVSESICSRIDDSVQYRPYFTYWITSVQILVFIVGCCVYGFAPIGLKITTEFRESIILPNQGIESVCWHEYDNLWIGPRQADLIRLGARYSPCMRVDINLNKHVLKPQKEKERLSGCCIRNDGGGCYQSSSHICSVSLSTWYSWKGDNISHRRSGPVCGTDPYFCLQPRSIDPFQWPDDITLWPICLQTTKINGSFMRSSSHMSCEVTGRPCCVGIKGECIITTKSHCDFMRGYFHSKEFLCSQVNCLSKICGMLYFTDQNVPDQYYRLVSSLFLHAGILHLIITVSVQLFFLRDFEKMMGWVRTSLIYILSGVFGNLMSATFLPFKVEAGPSGSCFAFLGVIVIEFLKSWKYITHPWKVLLKYSLFTLFLFAIGFLPWVDNYAHLAGFFSGILLSFVFLPFLGFPDVNTKKGDLSTTKYREWKRRNRRRALLWRLSTLIVCSILWLILLALLIIGFNFQPLLDCQWCKYFTCLPLGNSFCDNMDVNVSAQTPCLLNVT